jgi:hypothetical protein
MQSNDARKNSSKNLAFAQTPTSRQDINRISIKGKQSMLNNVPKLDVFKDTSLSVTSPIDVVKNALMLGLKVARIRVGHVEEDLESIKRNCISEGMGVQIDTRNLANQCKETQEDINMIVYSEFRDGFSPYSLITNKDGLSLHTLTLLSIDSTVDNSMCACPITLGHKQKICYD